MKDYSNITQKFYQASYNWNDMVARLKINKPIILLVKPGAISEVTKGTHACVIVGFNQTSETVKYFYLNDGFGKNNRMVEIRGGTMPNFIFLG